MPLPRPAPPPTSCSTSRPSQSRGVSPSSSDSIRSRLSNRFLSLSILVIRALTFMLFLAKRIPRLIRDHLSFLMERKRIQISQVETSRSSPLLLLLKLGPHIPQGGPPVAAICTPAPTATSFARTRSSSTPVAHFAPPAPPRSPTTASTRPCLVAPPPCLLLGLSNAAEHRRGAQRDAHSKHSGTRARAGAAP